MENTEISWTHNTFNPWIGCEKVSAACKHCYAETLSHRYQFTGKRGLPLWGGPQTADRRLTGGDNWRKPARWNREAQKEGTRTRVFCASLADVFEDREELLPWRERLFGLIDVTPSLDWLLLTKRPQNIEQMYPRSWAQRPPQNVWFGTTVEDRKALARIDHLRAVPATVRFLSIEPLLEDLGEINLQGIDWVIVGGESGHGARPMRPEWARSVRDQCIAQNVRFHFKQWGEYDSTGTRVGKHAAGRLLDGVLWEEYPLVAGAACGEVEITLPIELEPDEAW